MSAVPHSSSPMLRLRPPAGPMRVPGPWALGLLLALSFQLRR